MKNFLILFLIIQAFTSCESKIEMTTSPRTIDEIPLLMSEQQNCWNDADIDCFMSYYWQSDSLKFVSKNGMTESWNNVIGNYKSGYPTKEKMGRLQFDLLHQKDLGHGNAMILGKWQIFRSEDTLKGHFSLLWEVIDGEWKIVLDHTS